MARTRTSLRFLLATLVLALPPAYGLWSWKRQGPLATQGTVLVRKGTTVDQMAEQLEREGVIRSAALFKLWARARKLQLIRGEYTFSPRASAAEVAGKLRRVDIHWTQVVIPTGAHAWSVEVRLRPFVPEAVFWTLWKSPRLAKTAGFPEAETLEGLVAPATYKFNRAMEPEEIMLQLVETFRRQVLPKLEGGPLTPYQTLILASLVEKETRETAEQPRVAGVYAQRLKIGMRLQCDPTSLYARWLNGDLTFSAPTHNDVVRPHRFNTYTMTGLPPTPIAIPSPSAIEAAKAPQDAKDLYFVASGTGGHRFAPNLSQHNQNVTLYRQTLRKMKKK